MMKQSIFTIIGIIGGTIASYFGGWDDAVITLIIFMAIDYISGLTVAGIFHKSKKTKSGALESRAGLKGLIRKGMMLLIVLIAYRVDITMHTTIAKDAAVIGFIANELISIVENCGLMGIPLPEKLTNAIDVLKKSTEIEPK